MAEKIYLRMLVYAVTIGMHVSNIAYMNIYTKKIALDVKSDPQIEVFRHLQARFFTCWTFFLQILYAVTGLTCDCLTLLNSKNKTYRLPKYLKGFRDTLFSAVLWPSSWVVFLVFWSVYNYDRSLIYPEFVDQLLTPVSNHVMHTAIVPIVLLEVCLRPRVPPKSHLRNFLHLIFHFALYFCVLIYTYLERKVWIYPIFAVFYDKFYFMVLPLGIFSLALLFYIIQWPLTARLWPNMAKNKKLR